MSSSDDNGFAPGDTLTPSDSPKRSSLRALTKTTLALCAAVGLATVAAGGTYAYLNSAAPVSDAVTLTSGTASLELGSTLTGLSATLYPGITTYGTATIANTGDVPLAVSAAATARAANALAEAVTLNVGIVATADDCGSTFVGSPAMLAGRPVSLSPSFGTGTSQIFCVAITLPAAAPSTSQGLDAGFSFAINGTQAN